MDFTEIIKAMETMTDAQIESIQKSADGIMKVRDNERRVKAIQNFKEAFIALCKAGVYVSIECEDCDNNVYISAVEQFDFS
jgi:ATP-dependent 26S proteasome regulatory subunit